MKIFTAEQIREIDNYTIAHEPIASIDLMERAAKAFAKRWEESYSPSIPVLIFAGPGNNGGDALAIARLLLTKNYKLDVILLQHEKLSTDCSLNLQRLKQSYPDSITVLSTQFIAPTTDDHTVIIDGLFGTGIKRQLQGIFAEAVNWINRSGKKVVAIDIPSGLPTELNETLVEPVVRASTTWSFQFPKASFLISEHHKYVGDWELLDISLSTEAIQQTNSKFHYNSIDDIQFLVKKRSKFQHKGNFGHLFLVAGSETMAGAAVLSARAALRTGAGLVSVCSAPENRLIMQTAVPEAIFTTHFDATKHNTLAIGPGLGTGDAQKKRLAELIKHTTTPMIIDADGLTILANNKELLQSLAPYTILTPHPKELERLVGNCSNSIERIEKARALAKEMQLIVIVKGAHTAICLPTGDIQFNSTGNPGMATAGSGDVLTGIIGALLAQNYSPTDAASIGVYLHGKAADFALEKQSVESLIASDIIEHIGRAFNFIKTL